MSTRELRRFPRSFRRWNVPECIKNAVAALSYVENSDLETIERVHSMREVKAMFGTKLQQYGERVAQEAAKRARREGRQEGVEEGLETVALRMLDQGRPVEEISEITGLSKEQIDGLRKEPRS